MNVSLRTDIEDPLERLAAVHTEALSAKAYAQALGPRFAVDLSDVMPGNVLSLAIRTAAATGLAEASTVFNTIITNVPGAPVQLYLCGAALVRSMSLGPLLPNVGLFHVVYSTVQEKRGSVTLSFTACRDMLPDPGFYGDCLQASFEELREAARALPAGRVAPAPQRKLAKKKIAPAKKAAPKRKPVLKKKAVPKKKALPKKKAR
jgi:hypothetical protein